MRYSSAKRGLNIDPFAGAGRLQYANCIPPFMDFVKLRDVGRNEVVGGHSAATAIALL